MDAVVKLAPGSLLLTRSNAASLVLLLLYDIWSRISYSVVYNSCVSSSGLIISVGEERADFC